MPLADPALRPKRTSGYIATLDGWRAIAILVVLLDHSPTFGIAAATTSHFHSLGTFGVRIFFVLSGYLITSRLLDEEHRTGGLHLKSFYIRRVTRIQPVALVYLGVVAGLVLLHRLPAGWGAFVAAILSVRNLVFQGGTPGDWATAHFWSLSIEEQFYLFLPACLAYVRRGRGGLLLSLAGLDIAWFLFNSWRHGWAQAAYLLGTAMCIHFLLLASAAAVFLRKETVRRLASRLLKIWWAIPFALLTIPDHSPLNRMQWLAPTLLVFSTILTPGSWTGRLLELRPLRYVGRISYSLYVWQMIFLTGYFQPQLHPFGIRFPVWAAWAATFLSAALSYHLLEKPMIRVGHRLAHPATPGHADLDVKDGSQSVPLVAVPRRPAPALVLPMAEPGAHSMDRTRQHMGSNSSETDMRRR